MKLIDNIKTAWKLFSVQVAAFALAWGLLPIDQQKAILDLLGISPERMPAVIGIAFLVARIIKQSGK